MGGRTEGQTDGRTNGRMDGWMDGGREGGRDEATVRNGKVVQCSKLKKKKTDPILDLLWS